MAPRTIQGSQTSSHRPSIKTLFRCEWMLRLFESRVRRRLIASKYFNVIESCPAMSCPVLYCHLIHDMVRGISFYYIYHISCQYCTPSCNSTTYANRWNGCKKGIRKMSKGALKNEGKLWFCELSFNGIQPPWYSLYSKLKTLKHRSY